MKTQNTVTITFHKAINYGAVLQTYALQQAILKFGINNEVLNYSSEFIDKQYKLIKTSSIKSFIKSIIILPSFYYKKKKFVKFIIEHVKTTEKIEKEELKNFADRYDVYITGSDQVWNYELIGKDGAYLLDFVKDNNKKNAYAASFGVNKIPNILFSWYKNGLKDFSTILLREKTGLTLLDNLIHKKAKVVLDPVFLLDKKSWSSITGYTKFDNMINEYILIYMATPSIKIFADRLSKKYNLKIIHITDFLLNWKIRIGTLEKEASPEDFVSAIKNAKFVITSSFHGIVLSIIFNKNFFVDTMYEKKISTSSRQKDILKLLEVGDREVINHDNDDDFIPINWKNVNEKLEIERNKSLKELKRILGIED